MEVCRAFSADDAATATEIVSVLEQGEFEYEYAYTSLLRDLDNALKYREFTERILSVVCVLFIAAAVTFAFFSLLRLTEEKRREKTLFSLLGYASYFRMLAALTAADFFAAFTVSLPLEIGIVFSIGALLRRGGFGAIAFSAEAFFSAAGISLVVLILILSVFVFISSLLFQKKQKT